MEQALYDLIERAKENWGDENKTNLSELERTLDYDDENYAVLTEIQMQYFKLGLKAGIGLIKEID